MNFEHHGRIEVNCTNGFYSFVTLSKKGFFDKEKSYEIEGELYDMN